MTSHRGDGDLAGAEPKQRHHIARGQKRIGDDGAVREGERGHRVTVTLGGDEKVARLSVADDGPGVPPELIPDLFQRFVRGDAARTGEGFGLGLAISRAIAEAHHGSLDFRPSTTGAVFELKLPAKSPDE